MTIKLYNTLSRKIEDFIPLKKNKVGLYACGPTVYDYAHVGNLRAFLTWDILKRTFEAQNFKVNHVMNITDVGHLTDDDLGIDKIEKGAAREHKSAWEIAEFYTKSFLENLQDLNITPPKTLCRATDHITEQIALIKKLEKKGFTYKTADGIYFDTSKLESYGNLSNLKNQELRAGIRVSMGDKKNTTDFALWKFSPKTQRRQMEWDSPWGVGFPGWHIECSAMSKKYLGVPFDIHCGGIDLAPVHHTNEIAQTEAAEDVGPAKYWLHNEFLNFGTEKMSKSLNNFITLTSIKEKNISPLAYRYFILQTHYRKQLSFSWEALQAAQNGLTHLYNLTRSLPKEPFVSLSELAIEGAITTKFFEALNNDLDTPAALAILWEAVKVKNISQKTLLKLDEVLGLKINEELNKKLEAIPEEVAKLVQDRDEARKNKNWQMSDDLRDQLIKLGYAVTDTPAGTQISK
jgi:cysteinyl-tRNA synthetase